MIPIPHPPGSPGPRSRGRARAVFVLWPGAQWEAPSWAFQGPMGPIPGRVAPRPGRGPRGQEDLLAGRLPRAQAPLRGSSWGPGGPQEPLLWWGGYLESRRPSRGPFWGPGGPSFAHPIGIPVIRSPERPPGPRGPGTLRPLGGSPGRAWWPGHSVAILRSSMAHSSGGYLVGSGIHSCRSGVNPNPSCGASASVGGSLRPSGVRAYSSSVTARTPDLQLKCSGG